MQRLNYLRRVFVAYLTPAKSQLTFWHETPASNDRSSIDALGEYYMTFADKAGYPGPFDAKGVPLLDYHGTIGRQYNPIAIAQYGLANLNRYARSEEGDRLEKAVRSGNWLVENLQQNKAGVEVWHHYFDWDYRETLKAPWYSGLAQGQGISLLVRLHRMTGDERYLDAADRAFVSLTKTVAEGGVLHRDRIDDVWIEEYIVDPPTHILNGFMWASWGVFDYHLATGDERAADLFTASVTTIARNLHRFDTGYWSLYEQSGTRLKMMASPFYHRLHIVQLAVMARLSGRTEFREYADRWQRYQSSRVNRARALAAKVAFKVMHY